ncbi:EamA family transporter [Falsiroseomonas sp. HW251]|uniref:EamA family transporter n=1 Tax=Falsiroseomonas sp. HW251 TaxID=3390998 RepID=UPI003D31589A
MSAQVMLLVLLGAALHATWNALVKSGADKLLDTGLVVAGSALIAAVALPFLPQPAPASWPFILASGVIHLGYFSLVAAAYRAGDLSLAYPLMRGTPPLVVALVAAALLDEALRPLGWVGVALVSSGILAMAVRRGARAHAAPIAFALTNAVVIATYTLVDGIGARRSDAPVAYTLWAFVATAAFFLPFVAWRRPRALAPHLVRRWRIGLGAGGCTLGSYALALWAMTQAPIAAVAALRETSILFGVAIAAAILRERPTPARLAGAALIGAGAIALRLA